MIQVLQAPYTYYPNALRYANVDIKTDFGVECYNLPCDDSYWNVIKPIFARLQSFKEEKAAWHDMPDKEDSVYLPIVDAFIKEMNRAYKADCSIPTRLITYLLGIRDIYEYKEGEKNKATLIPKADLPTEIISLRFKPDSKSTAELYLNNGWSLSFRILNASTIVEPSLKFDIQFLGVPANIITVNCMWK